MDKNLNKKAKTLPLSYLLVQEVPYKSYIAVAKSKKYKTDFFQVQKFYKPICLI